LELFNLSKRKNGGNGGRWTAMSGRLTFIHLAYKKLSAAAAVLAISTD